MEWSSNIFSPFAALFVSVIWAFAGSVYSPLSERYSALTVQFARVSTGFIFFLAFVLLEAFFFPQSFSRGVQELSLIKVGWLALSLVGILGLADLLFLLSTKSLGVPLSIAISSIYPIWSALFGWALLGQRLKFHQTISLVAIIFSMIFLVVERQKTSNLWIRKKRTGGNHFHRMSIGVTLAFTTSLLWAFGNYCLAKGGGGVPLSLANVIRLMFSTILMPLFAILLGQELKKSLLPMNTFLKVFPLFFLEAVLGEYAYLFCMTHGTLAVSSALSSLSPMVAAVFAWYLGSEKFSGSRAFAIFIITLGSIFLAMN